MHWTPLGQRPCRARAAGRPKETHQQPSSSSFRRGLVVFLCRRAFIVAVAAIATRRLDSSLSSLTGAVCCFYGPARVARLGRGCVSVCVSVGVSVCATHIDNNHVLRSLSLSISTASTVVVVVVVAVARAFFFFFFFFSFILVLLVLLFSIADVCVERRRAPPPPPSSSAERFSRILSAPMARR